MPKSRTRAKRPAALSGIPASVVALAPAGRSPKETAAWCRAYLRGASGAPAPYRPGRPHRSDDERRAEMRGRRDSESMASEVAQMRDVDAVRRVRRDRMDEAADRREDERRLLADRLGGLGIPGLGFGVDDRLADVVGISLGVAASLAGASILPRGRR